MAGICRFICLAISASFLHFIVIAADKTCKRQVPCSSDDCFKLIPCFNGDCTEDGACLCADCWEGESCDQYTNRYAPSFVEPAYDVSIIDDVKPDQHIFTAYAIDYDDQQCKDSRSCPCSKIIYGISEGNADNLFYIDAENGHIRINKTNLDPSVEYHLGVTAKNVQQPGEHEMVDSTIVRIRLAGNNPRNDESPKVDNTIDFMPTNIDDEEVHSRRKRAVEFSGPAVPDNVTFALLKVDKYENVSTVRVGDKISFRLVIQFPDGIMDMLVELFTPDNETAIMKLCNPVISYVGSNLDYNNNTAQPIMDSKDGTTNYDRAIIDLGNVTNSGLDSVNHNASSIFIDYDAVMIENSETVNGSIYWVSAGAEYHNESEIYVAQGSFEAIIDELTQTRMPSFTMSGPSQMALDSSDVFMVDMFISHPSTNLRFDAFAPLNTTSVMSICGVTVKDVGEHYKCLDDTLKAEMTAAENGKGNWHGTLDLGTVTNTGTRENSTILDNDRITIAFVAHMFNDMNNVDTNFSIGVAVEVGGTIIWAAQKYVMAVAPVPLAPMLTKPKFIITAVTGYIAYVNRPSIIEVDMILPEKSVSDYSVEVLTPMNETIGFKICRISVLFQGVNAPSCGNALDPEYYTTENSTVTDRAVLKLGKIVNSGVKIDNQEANTVRLEIVVQPLNMSAKGIGEQYWVTIGVKYMYNDTQMWVGQQGYIIEENTEVEVREPPIFDISYTFGSDHVHVNDSREIQYEISTVHGVTYEPAHIEIIMPDNITEYDNGTTPLFTICSAKVLFAGKNVPCLNVTSTSLEISYTDRFNTGKKDKAVLTLGTLCNTGRYTDNATNDKVILAVVVKVEDHSFLQNGTMDWISAGIIYSNESMWIGQIRLYALRDMIASEANGGTPYLGLENMSNLSMTPIGYVTVFYAYVKIPPRSSMDYTLNVTSKSAALGICGLQLIKYGDYMPCMDTTIPAEYVKYPNSRRSESAAFYLGPITNLGPDRTLNGSNVLDDDTLLFAITTQLSSDSALVLEASQHDIDVTLSSGDGVVNVKTEKVIATLNTDSIDTNSTILSPPPVTFYMVNVDDEFAEIMTFDIGKGAAKRFITNITLSEDTNGELVVELFTPLLNTDEDMEVCDFQIIHVGENMPCLDKHLIKPTFRSRAGSVVSDVALLDLGFVCYVPFLSSDEAANTITIEGIILVDRDTQLTAANVTSSIKVGEKFIVLIDLPLTIEANVTESMYVNNTNSTYPSLVIATDADNMTIGQILTFQIKVHIPANTTAKAFVDVQLPLNESADLTVEAVRFVSSGSNLACLNNSNEYTIDLWSNMSTSQKENGWIDFGLITNTGMSYRLGTYQEADDELLIEFDIQMADSIFNEDGSLHEISFAVEYSGIIVLVYRDIKVIRDKYERPQFEILAENNYTESFGRSDTLVLDAKLKHLNTSTAEGINVTASFYLPPYVTALGINYSTMEAIADIADGSMVRIEFPRLFFTDVVSFGVLLQVLSNASTPVSIVDAITPYEAGGYMYWRPSQVHAEGEFFTTELKHVSYKVTAYSASDCLNALGMQDMRIQDCQISGSLSPYSTKLPIHGRLQGSSGWTPYQRGGLFAGHRHLQVYFGNKTTISKIGLQHPVGYAAQRVLQLQIYYSDDGRAWLPGDKFTPTPGYTDTEVPVFTPRDSRYIRLYILSNTGADTDLVGLKVELYGCAVSSDVMDACATPPQIPAAEFTRRSFLYDGTQVHVCDADPRKDLMMRCFSSVDGDNWKALDETIGNVIGYSPDRKELYGIDVDTISYMSSIDDGETWDCMIPSTWANVQSDLAFVYAQEVPWTRDAKLTVTTPHVDFTMGTWGATVDGMWYNNAGWQKRLDWETCCGL